eukprot:2246291-Karenia_brevis.AAC.1
MADCVSEAEAQQVLVPPAHVWFWHLHFVRVLARAAHWKNQEHPVPPSHAAWPGAALGAAHRHPADNHCHSEHWPHAPAQPEAGRPSAHDPLKFVPHTWHGL